MNDLIISFDKKQLKLSLVILICSMSVIFLFILFFKHIAIIKLLFNVIFICSVLGISFGIYMVYMDGPIAVLNKEGIWLFTYGFIPWGNIKEVKRIVISEPNLSMVAISFKDAKLAFKNFNMIGKISFFWSKIFYKNHIFFSKDPYSNNLIIEYSKEFMSKNNI